RSGHGLLRRHAGWARRDGHGRRGEGWRRPHHRPDPFGPHPACGDDAALPRRVDRRSEARRLARLRPPDHGHAAQFRASAAGMREAAPPVEIVYAADLQLGVSVGCRFIGTPLREILRILLLSVGSPAILVALTLLFAWLVAQVSSHGYIPLILAYSPGGLAEM